jgi:hypothetical protein
MLVSMGASGNGDLLLAANDPSVVYISARHPAIAQGITW